MPTAPETTIPSWPENLVGKLQGFVASWKSFEGTEQTGSHQFLQSLLSIYEVSAKPGTLFEQHPVMLRERGTKAAQASLFPGESVPKYSTRRMDMYLPRVCVWEMKSPSEKDLQKHHEQLLQYWAHVRTRYMVLCNFHEFWIYDTDDDQGHLQPKLKFTLHDLPARGDALLFLRGDLPDLAARDERVTAEIASLLGRIVREQLEGSKDKQGDRGRVTKLILQCVFAMFAEDTDLIPSGLFTEVMKKADKLGEMTPAYSLFDDFGRKAESERGYRLAPYVNGPLFDRDQPKLAITAGQVHDIYCAARDFNWQGVRPEIFGSIFEQALNAVERHEQGAHYTREIDIARVVGPTVVEPWRRRIESIQKPKDAASVIEEMKAFHVLDPACGCGNFLYVVYREMKRLEVALARQWTAVHRFVAKRKADIPPPPPGPYFTINQLHGIETNGFAAFLARVVLWIGEHLANRELGLAEETLPLRDLSDTVVHKDALFIDWPRPDGELAIVSNPPYLGVRKLRHELGDAYVEKLFARYPQNRAADYVTYWFTRALEVLRPGERAGYVATNSIAQNESREASIDRVVEKGGTLTDAWKSYPWPGEAAVHIGIVNWVMAFYDGIRTLDGEEVLTITPALTASVDATAAHHIAANDGLCFMGVTPGNNGFVLTQEQRAEILANDSKSESVIRPFLIGRDVNREPDQRPTRWIIDFALMEKEEAETFKGAMRHVRKHVYPVRSENPREANLKSWWQFWRAAPNLRAAIKTLNKVIVIPCVSPHLIISRQPTDICFDHQLMVVALSDWYHFGLLQSVIHSFWARTRGSTHEERLRYTNTTIFETFPFPLLPKGKYDPRVRPKTKEATRVAEAAQAFDELRSKLCRERGLGLTKIHNELATAGDTGGLHTPYYELNEAVCAAYGWPEMTWRDERETLRRLVALNGKVAGVLEAG